MLKDNFKILIIGQNSFIAKHFVKSCFKNKINIIACSHFNIPEKLDDFSWVINFSINPRFFYDKYSQIIDQDALIANKVSKYKNLKYVMISSRLVYGYDNSLEPAIETQKLKHKNNLIYGSNKIFSEKCCESLITPNNLLIVRGSNLFGYEIGRKSFFGVALNRLTIKSEILLDISKDTVKDFIPVNIFARCLVKLIQKNCSGIYNVGSGFGLRIEEVCNAIIEGFGRGVLKTIDNPPIKDQFILNNKKLIYFTNEKIYKSDIFKYAKKVGEKLKTKIKVKNNYA